jgi:hypothetical protein
VQPLTQLASLILGGEKRACHKKNMEKSLNFGAGQTLSNQGELRSQNFIKVCPVRGELVAKIATLSLFSFINFWGIKIACHRKKWKKG